MTHKDSKSTAPWGELAAIPGGRIMLLQFAIEEMQDGMETLGRNQEFIETVIGALDKSGVLTDERIENGRQRMNERIARCEPPFDRPFFFVDPDAPEDWRKALFWPAPAIERAIKAMGEGVFIPPR